MLQCFNQKREVYTGKKERHEAICFYNTLILSTNKYLCYIYISLAGENAHNSRSGAFSSSMQ